MIFNVTKINFIMKNVTNNIFGALNQTKLRKHWNFEF